MSDRVEDQRRVAAGVTRQCLPGRDRLLMACFEIVQLVIVLLPVLVDASTLRLLTGQAAIKASPVTPVGVRLVPAKRIAPPDAGPASPQDAGAAMRCDPEYVGG
jgi:hypothetical protein